MSTVANYFHGKSVLITGASSGIGAEIARQLGAAGAKLTIAARRQDDLDRVAAEIAAQSSPGGTAAPLAVPCDVSRDGDCERAVTAAEARWGGLDVVFANAGFGVYGPFVDLTVEDYRRQFETNVFGVIRTTYAALAALEKSGGRLVITGSVAGWLSYPRGSAYAMSKFSLRALANAISAELKPRGVSVVLVSPGFVDSNFRRVDNHNQVHHEREDLAAKKLVVPTDKAVREILRAVVKGKREAIITGHGKVLVAVQRFAPGLLRWGARRGMGPRRPPSATPST